MHESQALAEALNRTMASHAPGWTNHNDADPGVTILEVIAWLAEGLVYRGHIEGGESAAKRTIAALARLDAVTGEISVALAESWSGTKRPNYFPGKLLSPDDLTQELYSLREAVPDDGDRARIADYLAGKTDPAQPGGGAGAAAELAQKIFGLIDKTPLYYTELAEKFSGYDFQTIARALGSLHAEQKLWQDAKGRICVRGSTFAAKP